MSTTADLPVLIRTKFHRPRAAADSIPRPRLTGRLDRVWDLPFALVSAPAGFGKSTLLAAWLGASERPSAWLSLDENDNSEGLFLAYFIGALRGIFPDALPATEALLSGVSWPPLKIVTSTLLNELEDLDRDFVLVLDDYHVIHNQSVHDLISALLQHPTNRMHLVIATRRDPPLSLRLLRARDQIAEIRGEDLRLSAPEIATFLERALGTKLSDEALAVVVEKTEGWAAGLRLATLTLRYSAEIDSAIARLHTENQYVMDYLINEVQSHIAPAIQSFLLKTSILDRLCAPLCFEVIGSDCAGSEPQTWLEWLEQSGMFTMALDTKGQWYRYHQLFQDSLRAQLIRTHSKDEIAALHLRASAWFAKNEQVEAAVRHALAGGDTAASVRLVAQHRHALMNDEQWLQLDRWLRMFPPETVAAYPELLLLSAWIADVARLDIPFAMDALVRAERLITQMSDQPEYACRLRAEVDTIRIKYSHQLANDTSALIEQTRHALMETPKSHYMVRSVAWLHLALGYQNLGRLDLAYAALAEGRGEDAAELGRARARIRAMSCYVHWIAGDLPAMLQAAADALDVAQRRHLVQTTAWTHHLLSCAYYQRNELDAAEAHAAASIELRYAGNPRPCLLSAFVRASIQQARGEEEPARETVNWAIHYLSETHCESLLPLAEAFRAELAAAQGDLVAARSWASSVAFHVPLSIMAFFHAPQLTPSKILLADDSPASRQQAGEALAGLYDYVTRTHNTRFTIEVLALQALLNHAEGDAQASLALLQRAVLMAEPGGFIRLFADLGPRMAGLLLLLRSSGVAPGYIGRILVAFRDGAPVAPDRSVVARPRNDSALVEPLSDRELEVLALLAQRLSHKEIAQTLFIAPSTVKRHTTNIYQKLEAHSRTEAMAKATRLGLL